mmetsp:Transcript_31822/g.60811  ORF Transcript_31822/g.60811 Transcript_31822/m.60811 type:complete len:235 (-) Transcript_31822:517-1221(-)
MASAPPDNNVDHAAVNGDGADGVGNNEHQQQTINMLKLLTSTGSSGSYQNNNLHPGDNSNMMHNQNISTTGPYPTSIHRNISNQSTIDSGLSRNSHLDLSDPAVRRMFGMGSSSRAERQRRLRLIMDQCETVRFPFKKRLILANMNLSHEEIPVDQICSDRLGTALYKLSLSGNRVYSIPDQMTVKLTGLRVLDVSQCDLHSVPDKWDLPSLKKLNLSHNRILKCPSEVRMILV